MWIVRPMGFSVKDSMTDDSYFNISMSVFFDLSTCQFWPLNKLLTSWQNCWPVDIWSEKLWRKVKIEIPFYIYLLTCQKTVWMVRPRVFQSRTQWPMIRTSISLKWSYHGQFKKIPSTYVTWTRISKHIESRLYVTILQPVTPEIKQSQYVEFSDEDFCKLKKLLIF